MTDEILFDDMTDTQKNAMIHMYKDKLGIIFTIKHLSTIFKDVKDSTFANFSYDPVSKYVESFDAAFLFDYVAIRITNQSLPTYYVDRHINDMHNKVSQPNWIERLYTYGHHKK
jgi:propanediol utilization protein